MRQGDVLDFCDAGIGQKGKRSAKEISKVAGES